MAADGGAPLSPPASVPPPAASVSPVASTRSPLQPVHTRKPSGSSISSSGGLSQSGRSPASHSRSPSNSGNQAWSNSNARPKSLDAAQHRKNDSVSSAAAYGSGSVSPGPDDGAYSESNDYTRLKKKLLRTIYDELTKTFGPLDPYKVGVVVNEVQSEFQQKLKQMEDAQDKEKKVTPTHFMTAPLGCPNH